MARIYPFRAWRYNPASVPLDAAVTQPYDKISPAMQQAYYQRSQFNLVRVILGLPELFDAEPAESVYARAARDFHAWREQGVLVQEKQPCVFAYAQRFPMPGGNQAKERRGFISLGKLHEYADRVVFRVEETAAEAKRDRLKLLKATRAQFGQVLMLYSDPAGSVETLLFEGNGQPDAEVTDEHGVLHRIWRVSDPSVLRLLVSEMEDKKLILAAGQPEYEAALEYAKQHAAVARVKVESAAGQLPTPPNPEAAVMMNFVNMDSNGLSVIPAPRDANGIEVAFAGGAMTRSSAELFPTLLSGLAIYALD